MTIFGVRRRVVCYVTRPGELLVVDHVEDPASGIQVPSGGIRIDEGIDDAALREVAEHTGLYTGVRWQRSLAVEDGVTAEGAPKVDTFVHLEYVGRPRSPWRHDVVGAGGDAATALACRFVPLDPAPDLADGQAAHLDRLD